MKSWRPITRSIRTSSLPMRVLLLLPPMTQLNAPYPATAFLTGFLRSRGVDGVQADLAMELVLRLFSRAGLDRILARLAPTQAPSVAHLRANAERFRDTIEPTIAFLQGRFNAQWWEELPGGA